MTRRLIAFKTGDAYLVSQEFNGDKSEVELFRGHSDIRADWKEIVELFEGVDTSESFKEAVRKAEELYGYDETLLETMDELPKVQQVWVMSHGNLLLGTRYGEPMVKWLADAAEQFGFRSQYDDGESITIMAKNTDGRWCTWFTIFPDYMGQRKISGNNTDQSNIWLHKTRPDLTPERCVEFFDELSNTLELYGEDRLKVSDWIDPEDWQEIAGIHDAYEDARYTGKKEEQ